MYFFNDPVEFQNLLTQQSYIDDIYKAIEQDDKDEAVVTAMEILNKTGKMPIIPKIPALEEPSEFFRQLGEQAAEDSDYRCAFELYNQAIRCAPKNSNKMFEAYFARAKLFLNLGTCPTACLADIDRCLAWKKSAFESRLNQMKALSHKQLKAIRTPPSNKFIETFFIIREKHPKVPCVNAAVDFIIEDGQPKVIARKYIPTGTLVALEPAYVGYLEESNQIRGCYFCFALSLNLIPCDNCRYILFCSEECKKLCWEQYHSVECHIIHVLDVICAHDPMYTLTVKAAIKLKKLCSWEEFNSISSDLDMKPATSSSIGDIFDVNNKLSVLKCIKDKHFVFGETYNATFMNAIIIHYLQSVPDFFPRDSKRKDEAIRAMSRILVHLYVNSGNYTKVENSAKIYTSEDISTIQERNTGFFSFTSKLKHSCDPNILIFGLNNKAALIAVKPIQSGQELQVSNTGHWYTVRENRALTIFIATEATCRCRVCLEGWVGTDCLPRANMNELQRSAYIKWNQMKCAFYIGLVDVSMMYKETCHCLSALHDLPNTTEHKECFMEHRRLLLLLIYETTGNCTILQPPIHNVLSLRASFTIPE